MSGYFDVGKIPPGMQDSIARRCINLMCAMLKGVDYDTLYNKPFHDPNGGGALQSVIDNVNSLPLILQRGATDESPIVIEKLAGANGALVQIQKKLSAAGAPAIILGELFYEARQENPSDPLNQLRNLIVDTLEAVHSKTDDQMYHFCMPLLAMQLDRTPYTTQVKFEHFIDVLGLKTMQDFYDKPFEPAEKGAAIAARQQHILREKRPAESTPTPSPTQSPSTSTKGNKKKCSINVCVFSSDPDDWCSEITLPGGGTECAPGSS
ncbi:MAG: hypothetical protein L3K26_15195 [Candidatus Hydrogenedentes bacterium]|nr:hypothetical protein [Candidatus Hydrogenedentota bacterium]